MLVQFLTASSLVNAEKDYKINTKCKDFCKTTKNIHPSVILKKKCVLSAWQLEKAEVKVEKQNIPLKASLEEKKSLFLGFSEESNYFWEGKTLIIMR